MQDQKQHQKQHQKHYQKTPLKERILAPDVARGLMLLGIAIANVTTAWRMYSSAEAAAPDSFAIRLGQWAEETFSTTTANAVTMFNALFVHSRGLPMFACLFGFGLGLLALREHRRGTTWPDCCKLMVRRYGWLLLIGLVHMLFLFWGDIIFTYSLLGLVLIFLVPLRDKILLRIAAGLALLQVVINFVFGSVGEELMYSQGSDYSQSPAMANNDMGIVSDATNYFSSQVLSGVFGVFGQLFVLFISGAGLMALMIFGLVAARSGWFTQAADHLKLLVGMTIAGVIAAVAGGIPVGLATINEQPNGFFDAWTMTTGLIAGPGAIALATLITLPAQKKIGAAARQGEFLGAPWWLWPFQAVGQRSMSCYIGQSVILLPLASAWGLNILADADVVLATLVGIVVWLVTAICACVLAKCQKQGPMEALHRKLTYR